MKSINSDFTGSTLTEAQRDTVIRAAVEFRAAKARGVRVSKKSAAQDVRILSSRMDEEVRRRTSIYSIYSDDVLI
jgi:hypothetical protein